MPKIGMSCKDCVFNIKDFEDVQVDCKAGVLKTIKKESSVFDLIDSNYQFDRVCGYKSIEEITVEEAIEKMALKFHFIVIDSDLNETIRMLESIKNLVKEGCRVCIATTENYRELTKYADENKNYFISTSFNKDEDVYSLIDMAFKKMLTGYTVVLDNKDSITLDALNSIEQFINVKMKRLALVNNSPFVINNIIFKMLKGNKHYSFNDKIQELADMHSSTNMIYTWEDINETVNS